MSFSLRYNTAYLFRDNKVLTEEEREKFKRYYYDRCGWKTKRDEAVEDKTQAQQ